MVLGQTPDHLILKLAQGPQCSAYLSSQIASFNPNTVELTLSPDGTGDYTAAGQHDTASALTFDAGDGKLATIYDYHADGSYVYTEFNTSHPGQPWSQFQVQANAAGRPFGAYVIDAQGNPYAFNYSPLVTFDAKQVISQSTEIGAPASYYSAIGHGGPATGQTWVDNHFVNPSELQAAWSTQNASVAAGQIAPAVEAIPTLSNINVVVTGFGY
jgi:hypothetical protein